MKPSTQYRYILINKPYGVLCQFSDSGGRATLADCGSFPGDVYPAGRLDYDSEGLVLLTNDGHLKHALLDPKFRHPRTYLVQVERIPSREALGKIREGILIDQKKTLPAAVTVLDNEPDLPPRAVPIRFRKNVPTAWLKLVLREGRNRQVRRMTAKIGHPTLRLLRIGIGSLTLGDLKPGEHRDLSIKEITQLRAFLTDRRTSDRFLSSTS